MSRRSPSSASRPAPPSPRRPRNWPPSRRGSGCNGRNSSRKRTSGSSDLHDTSIGCWSVNGPGRHRPGHDQQPPSRLRPSKPCPGSRTGLQEAFIFTMDGGPYDHHQLPCGFHQGGRSPTPRGRAQRRPTAASQRGRRPGRRARCPAPPGGRPAATEQASAARLAAGPPSLRAAGPSGQGAGPRLGTSRQETRSSRA